MPYGTGSTTTVSRCKWSSALWGTSLFRQESKRLTGSGVRSRASERGMRQRERSEIAQRLRGALRRPLRRS